MAEGGLIDQSLYKKSCIVLPAKHAKAIASTREFLKKLSVSAQKIHELCL
jgi:hypothetical protein